MKKQNKLTAEDKLILDKFITKAHKAFRLKTDKEILEFLAPNEENLLQNRKKEV